MEITLIAKTEFVQWPQSVRKTKFGIIRESMKDAWHEKDLPNDMDTLAEFAGRSCYQAWHMPNPDTASPEGYLGNIIKQQHFSVLEHASATFYLEGVSRNFTHEIIRHRHLSVSELSQRYVNMEDSLIVIPPAVDQLSISYAAEMGRVQREAIIAYDRIVKGLEAVGIKGKKAREAARYVLPGGTETSIVLTGNMRTWRDVLHKRFSVHADAEMQEVAGKLLSELRSIAPASFQDFPETPFE